MKKPTMILFDYGQTLANEPHFDGEKGTAAVMEYAIENKYGKTPKQVQEEANRINQELGRFDPSRRHLFQIEVPTIFFDAYLYESMGIKLSISYSLAERIFWDNAAPAAATDGIEDFLEFLAECNIRTGVISNISYCGKAVEERIHSILPKNHFEFILASSEYVFRKPNPRIFQLALEKANLSPDQVWYIGDQYECDIIGARNAGIFPIWYLGAVDFFSEKSQTDDNLYTIFHWNELKNELLLN